MDKKPTIIITPTWNNEDYTIRCFGSIHQNTHNYKIIWVDNGSTEESFEKVKKFLDEKGTPYELIRNKENLGFVKATNQGMKRAIELGANYLVLQNNDTEVFPGWLERMQEVAEGDKKIGLVGPITSPCTSWQSIENLKKTHSEFFDFPEYTNPEDYNKKIVERNDQNIVFVDDYLAFFSVLIKREVVEGVGFLSEEYGVGLGDDNDYCARARQAGWELVLVKNVFVFHNHRTTFKAIYSQDEIDDMINKSSKFFREKHSAFVARAYKVKDLEGSIELLNDLLVKKDQAIQIEKQKLQDSNHIIQQKDQKIKEKNQLIQAKDQKILEDTQLIWQKERQLEELSFAKEKLENSKSFQIGSLFFRSLKNPIKWLTFPVNFFKIIFS